MSKKYNNEDIIQIKWFRQEVIYIDLHSLTPKFRKEAGWSTSYTSDFRNDTFGNKPFISKKKIQIIKIE